MTIEPRADSALVGEIERTLVEFFDSYASRDLARYLACFADEPTLLMYGTGADEICHGLAAVQAQAERDWTQSTASSIDVRRLSVGCEGPVAWAGIECDYRFTIEDAVHRWPGRMTVVLVRRSDRFVIVHGHLSVPSPDQAPGQSF